MHVNHISEEFDVKPERHLRVNAFDYLWKTKA